MALWGRAGGPGRGGRGGRGGLKEIGSAACLASTSSIYSALELAPPRSVFIQIEARVDTSVTRRPFKHRRSSIASPHREQNNEIWHQIESNPFSFFVFPPCHLLTTPTHCYCYFLFLLLFFFLFFFFFFLCFFVSLFLCFFISNLVNAGISMFNRYSIVCYVAPRGGLLNPIYTCFIIRLQNPMYSVDQFTGC